MDSAEIRAYKTEDIASIVLLLAQLQEAEHEIEPNRKTGVESAKSYLNKIRKELTVSAGEIVVAEIDNLIIGLLILFIEENDFIENKGKHVYISDIVIKKEYQGNRYGIQLLNYAEDFSRKNAITEIRVNALIKNAAALKLYHKANFEEKEVLLVKTIQ